MRFGLRGQFLVAGGLLLGITVLIGAGSALMFARLSHVVDTTLSDSEETMQATATIAGALEREDDALLLIANGDPRGAAALAEKRAELATDLARLVPLEVTPEEKSEAARLDGSIRSYHEAGDVMAGLADLQARRDRYHQTVNARLREAVVLVNGIRDRHMQFTEKAAVLARDQARKATDIAVVASLVALLIGAVVAFYF